MSAPCVCWVRPVSLHSGHCCMFDGSGSVPGCHPEVPAAIRGAYECGCLSWLDRVDGLCCPHAVTV